MTTLTEARDSIVTMLAGWPANYPSVPVFYDNAVRPDLDKLADYLVCEIVFTQSKQADIGPRPLLRSYGDVVLMLGVKVGQGSRASLSRMSFLSDTFRFKQQGGVVFSAPHLLPPLSRNGWFQMELVVPFYFDG